MIEYPRRKTRCIQVGSLTIGGDSPIWVQSMTNTETTNKEQTLKQVRELVENGCDIIRLAVPTLEGAKTFAYLKENGIKVPLVADIHFDYRIALACVDSGADKIRINPGNIGSSDRIHEVVRACNQHNIPIRIGVNSGSLEKEILQKYGAPTGEAIAQSALYHAKLLEQFDFNNIVLSVKSSDVQRMVLANRILSQQTDYPLHIGVTEAGGASLGSMKNAIGIGTLLNEGIGDTIRVSLTADPVKEVLVGKELLNALHLTKTPSLQIVSCPTCGRTRVNLIPLLEEFENKIDKEHLRNLPIKVAFMGCAVNGPGEAKDADIGIAGGDGCALLFRHGEIIKKYKENEIVDILINELKEWEHE